MNVLVTGANGLLGRSVIAELLARGHSVRAVVRPARAVETPWAAQVDLFRADLRTHPGLEAAFDGMDAVVHLAAVLTGRPELHLAGTVVGTERLLRAMRRSNVRRLVLASSFSVYDPRAPGRLTESTPLMRDPYRQDGYPIAKLWQERVVREFSEREGCRLSVLRPGLIWGRGSEWHPCAGIEAGPAIAVVGPLRRLPLTHAANCADCFATVLEDDRSIGHTSNVVDDFTLSAWDFTRLYQRRLRPEARLIPVPYWGGLAAASGAYAAVARASGRTPQLPSLLMPLRYRARFRPSRSSDTWVATELGWRSPHGLDDCVRLTYDPMPVPG